ncbi:MAG: hypothetical protein COB39_11625 [Marinosulfonomonas sp.]|nr:MAG: hypothetical protein COB39_11625 [Marinosulfonomonas sp.]
MNHTKPAILVLAFTALAAPALAGGFAFDLPRLTFPEPKPPVVSQTCTTPATLNAGNCTTE